MNSRVLDFVEDDQDLDLLTKMLNASEIQTLRSHQLDFSLNKVLNSLNKSQITLEKAQEQIQEIKSKYTDQPETISILEKF